MINAFMFPGQGCQKAGMGLDLYNNFEEAREYFKRADEFLGWKISEVMFYGSETELMETKNTQPAVFLYEVILSLVQKEVSPDVVAGHSLGEFAALVVSKTISFEDGLNLVLNRALIAQEVCDRFDSAMGAVIGFSDEYVRERLKVISEETNEPLYIANYNGPGQIVITGSKKGVRLACKMLKSEGAKKAVLLAIGGAFHSPFMNAAQIELGKIIKNTEFFKPVCPVIQCVDAKAHVDPIRIKENLLKHITHSVLWGEMVYEMLKYGIDNFYEVGTDDTLQKIVKRICPDKNVTSILYLPCYAGKIKDYSIK